jgi:hypothetical protein
MSGHRVAVDQRHRLGEAHGETLLSRPLGNVLREVRAGLRHGFSVRAAPGCLAALQPGRRLRGGQRGLLATPSRRWQRLRRSPSRRRCVRAGRRPAVRLRDHLCPRSRRSARGRAGIGLRLHLPRTRCRHLCRGGSTVAAAGLTGTPSIDGFTDAFTVFTVVAAVAAVLSLRLVPSGRHR